MAWLLRVDIQPMLFSSGKPRLPQSDNRQITQQDMSKGNRLA